MSPVSIFTHLIHAIQARLFYEQLELKMVTTEPIVAGDQIVSSNSPLRRSLVELPRRSGIRTENCLIPNYFDDMATLMYLIYQEAGKVTLETWSRFRRVSSFRLGPAWLRRACAPKRYESVLTGGWKSLAMSEFPSPTV